MDTHSEKKQLKEYDEIWAVDEKRVRAFFEDREANVTIIPLSERKLGSISLPQTRIRISGENAEELYHEFYLHFIAAGG